MEKIDTKQFIKDYLGAVKTQNEIDSIIPEIKLALASNRKFLTSEITSTEEIKAILGKEFDVIQEQSHAMSDTKATVSKIGDVVTQSSDTLTQTKDIISDLNANVDVVGNVTKDLSGTSKDMISNMKNISFNNTSDNIGVITDAFSSSYSNVMGEQKYIADSAMIGIKLIGGLFSDIRNKDASDVDVVGEAITDNNSISKQTLDIQEKTYNIQDDIKKSLNDMNDHQKSQFLEDQRNNTKKHHVMGGIKKIGITMLLGALVGGIARVYLKPFELILKGMKTIGISLGFIDSGNGAKGIISKVLDTLSSTFHNIYKYVFNFKKTIKEAMKTKMFDIFSSISIKISNWLKQFEKITPFVEKMETGVKWLVDGIRSMYGFLKEGKYLKYIFAFLGSTIAQAGVFLKAVTYGFKKLFYPLQIIFSVIDFVKGFMGSNEKTFMGKIKDGITNTIMSFLEFPINVFSWIINKLTGNKFENLNDNIIGYIKKSLSNAINFMLLPIRRTIDILSIIGKFLTGDFSGALDTFKSMIFDTFNSVIGLFSFLTPIRDYIVDKVGMFLEKDGVKDIFDPLFGVFTKVSDFIGHISDYVTDKMKKIPVIGKFFGKKASPKAEEMKIQKQIIVLQTAIQKQETEINSGDNHDWIGRERTSIIADKKKKIEQLQSKKSEYQKEASKEFTHRQIQNTKLQVKSDALSKSLRGHPELREAVSSIKKHEGYRKGVYRDSRGYWTGGYGTLLSKNRMLSKKDALGLAKKKGYDDTWDDEAKEKYWGNRLTKDVIKSSTSLDSIAKKRGVNLSPKQKTILTDMTYNLGSGGINKFNGMWGALRVGDTQKAATEMKNSKWYGQVKTRGVDLVSQMRNTTTPTEISSIQQSSPEIASAVQKTHMAKMGVKKKEIQTQNELNNSINNSVKTNKALAQNDQPVIIQNTNNEKGTVEPPEDIEAMSILWLNKSYGLG